MTRSTPTLRPIAAKKLLALLVALPLAALATPAHAYVDLAPTLTHIITESRNIRVVEVTDFIAATHTVTLKEVRTIKGTAATDPIVHDVAAAQGGTVPRYIQQWAAKGSRGILFGSGTSALVCFGEGWYLVRNSNSTWKLGPDRPDLPLAYYGSLPRLEEAVDAILAGKSSVITVVAYGADNEGASFDLALNRQNLPGLARLQRIRADQNMPATVAGASANPVYFIGPGSVDEADLPALLEKLSSKDSFVRAEAADDLRTLGHSAVSAVQPLTALLDDATPRVRFAAAAALLTIARSNNHAIDVLTQGLESKDSAIRLSAAGAAGFAGTAGASLSDKLAALLKDPDEAIRYKALLSITVLGASASSAVPAVTPLFDDPQWQIDAADALGRIGTAARPALKSLAKMLESDKPAVQWAAVRAMSQIGGPDAHRAVEYMIAALPHATEVEGYNIMIYLSLLGPVASDAAQVVQNTRIKNPVLPSATLWAMAPDKTFPWLGGGMGGGRGGRRGGPGGGGFGPGGGGQGGPGGFGPNGNGGQGGFGPGGNTGGQGGQGGFGPGGDGAGFDPTAQGGPGAQGGGQQGPGQGGFAGGPGGGGFGGGRGPGGGGGGFGGGPGGGADIFSLIYESYVHELGDRLRPAAGVLAAKIMDGSAGTVPLWGYKILAAGPDDSLKILTPYLTNADLNLRERAIVALGYMGETAAPAKPQIEAALDKAPTDREKNLIAWALRGIAGD